MHEILVAIRADHIYLLRLLIALVLGGLVGVERQSHGRAAGLRTNILVCLGSTLVIVSFQKIIDISLPDATSALRMDPARAAAGIITGIGFLGAGTIVKSRDFIMGLTTAASVWTVAAIGVAVGMGELVLGIGATMLVLVALVLLHRIPLKHDLYSQIVIRGHGNLAGITSGRAILDQDGFLVQHTAVSRSKAQGYSVTFRVRHRHSEPAQLIGDKILALDGVENIWIS